MEKYYIVDSTILPDVLDKVIEVRSLLQNGEVEQMSEAVKRVGISRETYYKYKGYVFLPAQGINERKAVISLMLRHDKGILSEVLNTMSSVNANILTINQNIPIHEWASVVLFFDLCEMAVSTDELLERLRSCHGVGNLCLTAAEQRDRNVRMRIVAQDDQKAGNPAFSMLTLFIAWRQMLRIRSCGYFLNLCYMYQLG